MIKRIKSFFGVEEKDVVLFIVIEVSVVMLGKIVDVLCTLATRYKALLGSEEKGLEGGGDASGDDFGNDAVLCVGNIDGACGRGKQRIIFGDEVE